VEGNTGEQQQQQQNPLKPDSKREVDEGRGCFLYIVGRDLGVRDRFIWDMPAEERKGQLMEGTLREMV
jgi:hypothetical protein